MRYVLPKSLTWWAGLGAVLIGLALHRGPVRRWIGGVLIVAYGVTVAWLLR